MSGDLKVTFWGVRGTIPRPGPETVRYGGNTACVEVCCGDRRLILDAGSGLRSLGQALMRCGDRTEAHLLLTHTHLDHIVGLPFFKPAYGCANRLQLWNGHLRRQGLSLRETLGRIMEAPFFPVPLDIMHACIAFHDFDAGEPLDLATDITIRTAPLNHPGGATGYRIEYGGRALCYVTDTEHVEGRLDQNILGLIADSDLVIYDSTYTDEEYLRFRGWGHSTWSEGVRLCKAAGARSLVAFHHDPEHDDDFLDSMDKALAAALPGSFVAREALTLVL